MKWINYLLNSGIIIPHFMGDVKKKPLKIYRFSLKK